jgi:hypothetical protein
MPVLKGSSYAKNAKKQKPMEKASFPKHPDQVLQRLWPPKIHSPSRVVGVIGSPSTHIT